MISGLLSGVRFCSFLNMQRKKSPSARFSPSDFVNFRGGEFYFASIVPFLCGGGHGMIPEEN